MVADGKWHIVTKQNSDSSVLIGDLVAISESGNLWKSKSSDGSQSGWINKEDLTPEIMDFEVEEV